MALFILKILGWSFISDKEKQILRKNNKLVVIFPHTSYWDSTLMIFFRLAYPETLSHLLFLIRPDFLSIPIFGKFLVKLGAIPATCINKKNGGRTKEIIDYLNTKKKFLLAISPKGTTHKAPWKNGWYHVTKGTEALITAVGYNYKEKRVIIFDPQNSGCNLLPQDKLEIWLKERLTTLPQKNPQNLEY